MYICKSEVQVYSKAKATMQATTISDTLVQFLFTVSTISKLLSPFWCQNNTAFLLWRVLNSQMTTLVANYIGEKAQQNKKLGWRRSREREKNK